MARVTIEDCLEKVEDRFELVSLSAQRARDIASGSPLTIERKGEKDTVIALREIAEGTVEVSAIKDEYINSFQSERDLLQKFVSPSAGVESAEAGDSISIDEEEADIQAAIASASEDSIDSDLSEIPAGYGVDSAADEVVEADSDLDADAEEE